MSEEINRQDLSGIIAENFGANATYVEGLLNRYRSNPSLVDEAWRAYFAELLGDDGAAAVASGGNGAGASGWPAAAAADGEPAAAQTQPATQTSAAESARQAAPAAQAPTGAQAGSAAPQPQAAAQVRGESQPIRGGALKIVENMEASLTVPTATSNRQHPRQSSGREPPLINKYLKEHERGKASYTHLIAWAICPRARDVSRS